MPGYPLQGVFRATNKGAAGAEAKIELPKPSAELRHRLVQVICSYGGTGTLASTAMLTIEDGLGESVQLPIAVKGPVPIALGWRTPNAVTVKLSAGGAEVVGSLVLVYSEE